MSKENDELGYPIYKIHKYTKDVMKYTSLTKATIIRSPSKNHKIGRIGDFIPHTDNTVYADWNPLSDLKVDDKVIVWDDEDHKYQRHFSHFDENNSLCTFTGGRTEWGSNGRTMAWNNYEIVEAGSEGKLYGYCAIDDKGD